MEIIRDLSGSSSFGNIQSHYFGTLEELMAKESLLKDMEAVVKPAFGAMSKGVSKAKGFEEIFRKAKRIGRAFDLKGEIRDFVRLLRHKGYRPESKYRRKFIVQNLISDLPGDWKVLIYGNSYYVLRRDNRINDFRASGGGRLFFDRNIPDGLLEFSRDIYNILKVPCLSLDIGHNRKEFFVIEFQALYFGTYTLENAEFHYSLQSEGFRLVEERSILEQEYARSIVGFIDLLEK
jgi:hypothetical protein